MKLTDALLGEHGAFHALFDHVAELASTDEAGAQIRGAMAVLTAMVDSHATVEEDLLFSALEPVLGKDQGPLAVMRAEHEEMERRLEEIEGVDDAMHAVELVAEALDLARGHFRKEEQVLFPLAERLLGEDTLMRLGRTWAERRRVTLGQVELGRPL